MPLTPQKQQFAEQTSDIVGMYMLVQHLAFRNVAPRNCCDYLC